MDDVTEGDYLAGQQVKDVAAIIDAIKVLTHDIRWMGLRLDDSVGFQFTAGRYVEVAVPGLADTSRSFSPDENGRIDLIIKILPGGTFSAALDARIKPGRLAALCVLDLTWLPENIVRTAGERGALILARDTVLRGVAKR